MLDPVVAHAVLLIVCIVLAFPVLFILDQALHFRHHARDDLHKIDSKRPPKLHLVKPGEKPEPEPHEDDPCRSSLPPRS